MEHICKIAGNNLVILQDNVHLAGNNCDIYSSGCVVYGDNTRLLGGASHNWIAGDGSKVIDGHHNTLIGDNTELHRGEHNRIFGDASCTTMQARTWGRKAPQPPLPMGRILSQLVGDSPHVTINEHLECPICFERVHDVALPCGHMICRNCARELGRKPDPRCYTCQKKAHIGLQVYVLRNQ